MSYELLSISLTKIKQTAQIILFESKYNYYVPIEELFQLFLYLLTYKITNLYVVVVFYIRKFYNIRVFYRFKTILILCYLFKT